MTSNGAHREITPDDLTPRQREVAELVWLLVPCNKIAETLTMNGDHRVTAKTIYAHLQMISMRLPDDGQSAYRRIKLWMDRWKNGERS